MTDILSPEWFDSFGADPPTPTGEALKEAICEAWRAYLNWLSMAEMGGQDDLWSIFLDACSKRNLDADAVQYHCDECLATLYEFHKKRKELARARAAPVVVLGLGTGAGIPPGFGALTGPDVAAVTRGVLFESSYAPHRAPAGGSLLKVIAGGAPRPEVVGWGDEDLVERVGGEAAQIAGCPPEWSFTEIVRLPAGIPQYPVGHGTWLDEVARLTPPGLHLTGWGYRGVGAAHVAADAAATARRIAG